MRCRVSASAIVAIGAILVLASCSREPSGPTAMLITQFEKVSVPGTPWIVNASESDRKIYIGRHVDHRATTTVSSARTVHQGWFVFVENDKRVWEYDGDTNLYEVVVVPDELDGTITIYRPQHPHQPLPDEVRSRPSPAVRRIVEDDGRQL